MKTPSNRVSLANFRLPLHVAVAMAVTLLVGCVVIALTLSAYRGAERSLAAATDEAISQAASLLDERIGRIYEPADNQLRLLAHGGFATAATLEERLALLPLAREVLAGNPIVQAVYAGYPNGDFVLFRPLPTVALASRFAAPGGADMLVQSIVREEDGSVTGSYRFYGGDNELIERRDLPEYVFDPRERPWYAAAMGSRETILTEPYLFFTTRVPGVTMARRTIDRGAVVGLDAEFAQLTSHLDQLRMTASGQLAIVDATGTVIAYHDATRMLIPESGDRFRLAKVRELDRSMLERAFALDPGATGRHVISIDSRDWYVVRMPLDPIGSLRLSALLAIPEDEMFADARRIVTTQLAIALAIFGLSVPLGLWLTHHSVAALRRIAEDTRALEAFDFTERAPVGSHIVEIDQLAHATSRLRRMIADFLDTSVALSVERDVENVLEAILATVLEATRASGGAIYRLGEDGERLERVRLRGSTPQHEQSLPPQIEISEQGLVAEAATGRRTGIEVVADDMRVAAPLINRDGDLVGAIVVWLPLVIGQQALPSDSRVGFIEALSATAAVAIETSELIESQKRLLESFIELIASAIDAKSPYTGAHCQRVPALAKMLAEAAHGASQGSFADFRLDEDDREALHIAAWLHDCGKITTPEHVVDKATKLECIYDRIHEVRMRFEVLKRDARIAALEARLAGEDTARIADALADQLAQLDEEFAFVAACNLGGEAMDDASVERLRLIGQRTWQRTLDDRLGISRDESLLRDPCPPQALPAEERLLADQPWHRVERPESERIAADNPWGIAMDVPRYKVDRGELHNLSIRRGTLTPEDRYIINHHIVQTIMMLSRLPFPRHLAKVPEIAGGHHERMDGRGYPRRLRREDMSVLARAMALADVFEALTATDRPYKAPKTLSESVAIMARMVSEGHLDPDLFELFLRTGIYRQYARRFLDAAQVDDVDERAMLSLAGSRSD
jgi:HD-GYP domain-containing protein (c-di-GMP phosphodiesterase class II)